MVGAPFCVLTDRHSFFCKALPQILRRIVNKVFVLIELRDIVFDRVQPLRHGPANACHGIALCVQRIEDGVMPNQLISVCQRWIKIAVGAPILRIIHGISVHACLLRHAAGNYTGMRRPGYAGVTGFQRLYPAAVFRSSAQHRHMNTGIFQIKLVQSVD